MQEMDTSRNVYYDDGAPSLDMGRLAKNLTSKLWAILLVGAVFAAAGFAIAKATYVEQYKTEATLGFMETDYVIVKDYSNSKDTQTQYKQETKFFADSDVPRYQHMIKGTEMIENIQKRLAADDVGKEYDYSYIMNSLNVSATEDDVAGFFIISVTSDDKGYCERAIDIVIEEFPKYIQSFDNTISIKTINVPSDPYVSNSDGASTNAMYGFIIGALIIMFIVLIMTLVTNTVLTLDDLRRDVNVKILGSVPLLEKSSGLFNRKKKIPQGSLLITDSSKVSFTFVESFKSIRTKIENIQAEKGYKVFVVTSTYEDEGKTTVAVNIACSLAQKGKSVLLVDSDLRKPAILHAVGVKSDTRYGLIPIIKGTSTYIDSIKFIKSLGIFVLPTGGVSLKSTEVLDTEKVKNVLEQARKEFDYIIIDSPPAHVVTDSLVIAPLADGMIYNVRRDYARTSEINRTIEEIRGTDIDIVGAIFTMSSGEENSRYYKKKGYFRYGRYGRYGSYYGRRKKKKGGYGYGGYGGYGYGGYGYGGYGYGGYGYGGYGYGGYGYGYGYGYGGKPENENKKEIDKK
ncbi:MAG: polysaccharide biosynthesis tyrosine autokinase [Clostridia bacterium]|nr:polysaccharide biosynthesis tyrosine autokinase [Clostridia bacterium]